MMSDASVGDAVFAMPHPRPWMKRITKTRLTNGSRANSTEAKHMMSKPRPNTPLRPNRSMATPTIGRMNTVASV